MLKWCSYCQQFMHEIAPFDDFRITHGLCTSCRYGHDDLFENDVIRQAQSLRKIFHALFDAGRREDLDAAARIVEQAVAAECRPVDILIGMISPMLYEIGEEWKRGALSVEAEHHFTAFSKEVVRLIEARISMGPTPPPSKQAPLFLMNAPGNQHDLAVRILSIWLKNRGMDVRMIESDVDQNKLLRSITAERPKYLLISMALTEQQDSVAAVAKAVQTLPDGMRPKIIVGGYPVKAGLIGSIPATEFSSDISSLPII